MFSVETLTTFVVAAFIMVVIPGPTVLFTIGRAMSLGRLGGFLSIVGTAIGSIVLVVAVALGVGTVVAQSVVLFTIVKVLGAGYLIYLGIQAIRHRRDAAEAMTGPVPRRSGPRLLVEGFVVGVTNPKSIAFFLAILPQFVDLHAGSVPMQLFVLGAIVVMIGVACDALWVLLASAAREWFGRSPRRIEAMSATGGGLMIGLGVFLLVWSEKPASA
ncbi:threonine/homoserine/homoserine lactone efflux protein [Microbacterium phyllosphaerae]|uniref:Threonine/homoserine/homoserine lactone efflux protein n=1 Tax=Microbacterium phyllosphaerae TaxID=124798 RepID=A0ABS4WNC4_9MICO|nr:LysE family translocator [Microbacterium phyllosphaerae]MBP2377707.1 threonine/homoserine/homoserine lactone efflux protein [Microbacterium phyllosphaerae]